MEILFWILVAGAVCFIGIKAVQLNKKSNAPKNETNSTGGGYIGQNDGVAGELPKDNIK